jgi:hypothetical protein
LTKAQLKDKIMGGWAGQTIGVTFGSVWISFWRNIYRRLSAIIVVWWLPEKYHDQPRIIWWSLYGPDLCDVFEKYGLMLRSILCECVCTCRLYVTACEPGGTLQLLHGIKAPQSGYCE